MTFAGYLGYGIATAVVGIAIWANLPTSITLPSEQATLDWLKDSKLMRLSNLQIFKAEDLFRDTGAVIMAIRRPG